MRILANTSVLFLLLVGLRTYCQPTTNLTQVAQINLKEHPDSFRLFSPSDEDHGRRAPLFSVALAPDGDLLALIAKQSGPWQVVRVKNWLGQKPVVDHLDVPGYSKAPSSADYSIKPQMIITSDGKYLVTVVPEPWPEAKDSAVDVIDLQTFRPVATQRSSMGTDWQLDPEGDSLQVHGLTPHPSKPVGSEQWLTFLSLPSLKPFDRCDYSVVFNPPYSLPVIKAEFHGAASPACTREAQSRLANQNSFDELPKLGFLLESACGVESATPDHAYAVGTCRDCRQKLFGVSCKSEESEVYNVISKQKIANLSHAPHRLTEPIVAFAQGKLYLLALENAEKLTVYRVTTSP